MCSCQHKDVPVRFALANVLCTSANICLHVIFSPFRDKHLNFNDKYSKEEMMETSHFCLCNHHCGIFMQYH